MIFFHISLEFCKGAYLGKMYTPIVFGGTAPSVPSFMHALFLPREEIVLGFPVNVTVFPIFSRCK